LAKTIIIYDTYASFVKQDIEILGADGFHFHKNYLYQLWFFLTHRYDRYIIYFCNSKALIPILFSRLYWGRSIIFIGGYDATYIPEINYGAFSGGLTEFITRLAYRTAHKIVISSGDELKDRLLEHINVKCEIINCGIDTDFWRDLGSERTIYCITVADIHNESMWIRKGMDKFIELANDNPDKIFMVVNNQLDKKFPKNVRVLGYVHRLALRRLYNASKYYAQLSVYESFGIALAEAMSCGCLPIVSDVGVMKDIAGNVKTPKEAHDRINYKFSLEIRKHKLEQLLK